MRFRRVFILTALLVSAAAFLSHANAAVDEQADGIRLTEPQTHRFQVGVIVKAQGGSCTGVMATMPVPMDWPEQQVKIVDRRVSSHVRRVSYRTLDDGVRQMMVSIPRIAAGQTAEAVITFEVAKRNTLAPQQTDQLSLPRGGSRSLKKYLGVSPFIDARHVKIRALAEEAVGMEQNTWKQVEAIYDLARAKVQYKFDVKQKSSLQALEDGHGDCEELTSLFVAMCRSQNIPARSVWVPGHCYPEFYLVDSGGKGHWFPCQAAGDKQFGAMTEARPILQKGDSFRIPGIRQPQRYAAQRLTAKNAQASPVVEWIQRSVSADGKVEKRPVN